VNELSRYHRDLLQLLVEVVVTSNPQPWEGFMARHVGSKGTLIYHSRAKPIPLRLVEDLSILDEQGWIELHELPSGTRVFHVTKDGCRAAGYGNGLSGFVDAKRR
jgi:hypothetical protein